MTDTVLPGVLYISILQAEQGEVASKTTKLVLLDSLLQETAHVVRSLYLQEPTGKNLKWRIAAKWTIWTETGSESSKISLPGYWRTRERGGRTRALKVRKGLNPGTQ